MAATDHSPHIAHVALRVSDPDRSSAFYQHVTGMAEQVTGFPVPRVSVQEHLPEDSVEDVSNDRTPELVSA